jgi:hypothetical protein
MPDDARAVDLGFAHAPASTRLIVAVIRHGRASAHSSPLPGHPLYRRPIPEGKQGLVCLALPGASAEGMARLPPQPLATSTIAPCPSIPEPEAPAGGM